PGPCSSGREPTTSPSARIRKRPRCPCAYTRPAGRQRPSRRPSPAEPYLVPSAAVTRLLEELFPARKGERLLTLVLFFHSLFAVAFALEHHARPAFYASLYVYVEVMGALTILQFWTLANEIFHAREAKRLYGLIGSGGTLANVLVGLATSRIATRFGAPAVL